jgi:hypothetical protein
MPAEPPSADALDFDSDGPRVIKASWLLDVFRFVRGGVGHASRCANKPLTTQFTQLNQGRNAEPNAPHIDVRVDGSTLTLSFLANPFQFPEFVDGQIIRLRFDNVWRYAIGDINDEGWYRGQCRFSKTAPAWGEFYEVTGDLRLDSFDADWKIVSDSPADHLRHFLFYFRDENFECDATSWERIQ